MQRDYIAKGLKVKQVAIFDLDEFYKMVFRWFETNDYEFQEKEYRQSIEPGGQHVEIRWYAERKMDDYVKFVMEVDFLITGLQDVVTEREGKKIKTNKGSMELRMDAYLLKDYEDRWTRTALIEFFRAVYDKFIIRNRMEAYETELFEDLQRMTGEMKSFLALHKF